MRTHSFPADFIAYLRDEVELGWESAYRLCGNSIPVGMLSGVVRHITADVTKPQVVAAAAAANKRRNAHRGDRSRDRRPGRRTGG